MHQLEWHKFPQICRVQCIKSLYKREDHNWDFRLAQTRMLAKWIQPFTLYKATTTLGTLIKLINRQFVRHIASSINSPNNESELNTVFFFSFFFVSAFLSSSAWKVEHLNWQKIQQWKRTCDEGVCYTETTMCSTSTSRFFYFYCWGQSN